MRLLGLVLIAASGLGGGLCLAEELKKQARRSRELSGMLSLMGYELERFHTPLPTLFDTLSRQLDGPAAALCREMAAGLGEGMPFGQLWRERIAPLSRREREILAPLGGVLGRYGAEEQKSAVDAANVRMLALCEERESAARERGRVYAGVGAAGGLMLAVLLMG